MHRKRKNWLLNAPYQNRTDKASVGCKGVEGAGYMGLGCKHYTGIHPWHCIAQAPLKPSIHFEPLRRRTAGKAG